MTREGLQALMRIVPLARAAQRDLEALMRERALASDPRTTEEPMNSSLEQLISELREEREDAGGVFDGELYFSCENQGCPARTFDVRVIERQGLRLKMLPKCSFCNQALHYAGLHSK